MDGKKIITTIGIILIIGTASFFGGYSIGRNRFDDSRIIKDTALIRQQDSTIEDIGSGIEQAIDEVGIIEVEVEEITGAVEIINSGIGSIKKGLQVDIEGISGVIERLEYYRKQGEVLENSNTD